MRNQHKKSNKLKNGVMHIGKKCQNYMIVDSIHVNLAVGCVLISCCGETFGCHIIPILSMLAPQLFCLCASFLFHF